MDHMRRRKINIAAVAAGVLLFSIPFVSDAFAGMNLETGAAVSGIAVALNNYYARTTSPEQGLAETVMMASHGTIVIDDEKTSTVRQKLVDDSTPVQEKIVTEEGITYGTVKGTASLRLREAPNSEARTLTLLAEGEHYVVIGQEGDFLQVQIDDDLTGYVFKDYIDTSIKYDDEITSEELKAKAEQTERLKAEAEEAMKKLEEAKAAEAQGNAESKNKETTKAEETKAKETKKPVETTKAPETKAKESKAETSKAAAGIKEEPTKKAESQTAGKEIIVSKPTAGSEEKSTVSSKPDTAVIGSAPPKSGEKSGEGMIESKPTAAATETAKETTVAEKKTTEAATKTQSSQGPGGSVNSATRNAMVAYAKQYLGGTYVYGGTDMENGVDCSGFTMRIYEHFGYDIGRTSRDQAASGTSISLDNAQPGDLVFYDKDGTINHVGMYIGGGQVIHASSSTTGIIISSANYRTPAKVCRYLN